MNASAKIDVHLKSFGGWCRELSGDIRRVINEVNPALKEEWKWGKAVWTYAGKNIVALGAFGNRIKINFFEGAIVSDPNGFFDTGYGKKKSRSIELKVGERIDESALKELVAKAIIV